MKRTSRIVDAIRESLFVGHWLMVAGGAALVLGVFGTLEMTFSFRENVERVAQVQGAEARAAAARIEEHLRAAERAIANSARQPWGYGPLTADVRREEYARLLARMPLIEELFVVDVAGRERLHVSRVEPDRIDALRDWSGNPVIAMATQIAYGTPQFRNGFEPFVQIAVPALGEAGDRTVAVLSLRILNDVVRAAARPGAAIFVVDAGGQLLAHPNPTLVLERRDLRGEPLWAAGEAPVGAGGGAPFGARRLRGLSEADAYVSAARLDNPHWIVFVEEPAQRVLGSVKASAVRLALMLLLAFAGALTLSGWIARRLTQPILTLKAGTERFGAGNLGYRIQMQRRDEVGQLAAAFNRMAAQLQDYTESLERKVAEKTAEIATANRHKSEFLANVSHELRTPLNAILGFSEALDERLFGELNERQAQYVRDIHNSGRHLLALINDLLDLSKIEAGRLDLEPTPVDVPALVEGAVQVVAARAAAAGVRLAVEIEPGLGAWRGDARRLHQILLNLLSNAVKFTPAGGDVRVRAAHAAGGLAITVADNGVGIAPEQMQRLFAPFAQARSRGLRGEEGTGLGLALSRWLAELHGGRLEADSAPGRGSTFTLWLPAAGPTEAA